MDYTDYGSNFGKNSSSGTGAYPNGPRNSYGSSIESKPGASGSFVRSSDAYAQRDSSPTRSYFSADAFGQGGGSAGGKQPTRGASYEQGYSRSVPTPPQDAARRGDAGSNTAAPKTSSVPSNAYDTGNTVNGANQTGTSQNRANGNGSNGKNFDGNGVNGNGVNGSGVNRNGVNRSGVNGSGVNENGVNKNSVNGNSTYKSGAAEDGTNAGASRLKYTSYSVNGTGASASGNGGNPAGGNSVYRSENRNTNGSSYHNINGNGGGNGNGSSRSGGNGSKKPVSLTPKQKFVAWLKRFLRSIYKMGRPMRIFVTSAVGFVLVCVILILAISGTRQKKTEMMAAQLALATTPAPTIAATATPVPTPSPTPEIRMEKGAEGEDVMALQKRLMELGYLAIDEPTSYFGNATKYAVKLFQRQHELQQDGICGNDTIALLYSEEAKKYVMTEGAEGDDIESFQEQLVELGYLDDSQVTGYYGTDTVEAVKKFQNRNYITKDGKAGEQTLEEVNSADARVSYTKEKEIEAEKKKQAALARASSPAGRIDKMISIAKKQLGDTYILGKSGPDSFDCSGLVYYCLRQVNVYTRRLNAAGLSRTSSWTKISDIDNVKAGDLLFFKSDDSSSIGHVGIYIGGGEMVDASSANGKVVRRGAKTSYWRRNFVVARRPIE